MPGNTQKHTLWKALLTSCALKVPVQKKITGFFKINKQCILLVAPSSNALLAIDFCVPDGISESKLNDFQFKVSHVTIVV